jgi:hypothetical protein
MGNFGKSLSRELGKNTGKVISNVVFGDKWSTPKRVSATVKIAEIKASQAEIQANAIREKAELDYKVQIDKIKLEQSYEQLKNEENLINQIVKIHLSSDKDHLFQNLNELFTILQGTDSDKVINASIEKIKSGIFKLEQIGGESEATFFKSKLDERESERKLQEDALKEIQDKNKKEKKYTLIVAVVFFILVYTLHTFHIIGSFLTFILYMLGCWIFVYAFRGELKKLNN